MKPYKSDKSKKEQVQQMFDNIAPTYDRLNHTLSLNIDRLWRRRTVKMVARYAPKTILDMATGTGDLALVMARRMPQAEITGIDLSEGMLEVARQKASRTELAHRVKFEVGDAEHINHADGSFDAATVAFGVRNFGDIEQGLCEMARVLREGGRIFVLEFSTPRNRFIRWAYGIYSHKILPRIGGAISHDRAAYQYLPESVEEFPSPERFMEIMRRAGLKECRARSLTFGIAHIYIGIKR